MTRSNIHSIQYIRLVVVVILTSFPLHSRDKRGPLTFKDIKNLLSHNVPSTRIIKYVKNYGANFVPSEDIKEDLIQLGATKKLIDILCKEGWKFDNDSIADHRIVKKGICDTNLIMIAYSLKRAETKIKRNGDLSLKEKELGGINELYSVVYNTSDSDVILVGLLKKGKGKAYLHDFIVMLRAILIHDESPYVLLETRDDSQKMRVHYGGGIENTNVGKDIFDADIALKGYIIDEFYNQIEISKWGMQKKSSKTSSELEVLLRIWSSPKHPIIATRNDIGVVKEFDIGITVELLSAWLNNVKIKNLSNIRKDIDFFIGIQNNNNTINEHAFVSILKKNFFNVAVALLIKHLGIQEKMNYWLYEYKIPEVETIKWLSSIKKSLKRDGNIYTLNANGKINLDVLNLALRDGDITALRDLVIMSKPVNNEIVSWEVPVGEYPYKEPGIKFFLVE